MVQRPPDLDTACSLAALQEDVGDGLRRERFIYEPQSAPTSKADVPLPLPPPPRATAPAPRTAEDRRSIEAARAGHGAPAGNGKVAALKAWRKARGLCFKCGERWGREHTCPASIQLHVLEELLDVLDFNASEEPEE